jgi:hypothetical protein
VTKNWWFKFDFRVWRTDSDLRRCSLETRAFWLEVLCVMHEKGEYKIEGTYEEMGWLIGCAPEVVARCVIELQRTKTADVTLGNGSVTLLSRRLKRELSDREKTRLRVQRHRGNADVTLQSKSKSNKKEIREEKEAVSPPTPRATRIPEPFLLTSEMKEWAAARTPSIDLLLETEKFVNYWRAKSGRDATKLDWPATWRNWVLNARTPATTGSAAPRFDPGRNDEVSSYTPDPPCAVCGKEICLSIHREQVAA